MALARLNLLTVNAGSSSLKLRLLDPDDQVLDEATDVEALDALQDKADAVVHRVVHGGTSFDGPVVVDDDVESRITELIPLAPLHQPKAVELIRRTRPAGKPVVACFDTAFHRTIPEAAATYALPASWRKRWQLRKYGFHGLSHQYVARRVHQLLGATKIVSCHLGAGASACAVDSGRSVETTMGFTPADGLVMATRSGSVDPGLLLWLHTEGGLRVAEISDGIEHQSGLLGLSEHSGDMRKVLAGRAAGDERCALAFDVYVHRLAGEIARMAAAMGGVEAIGFTGGVGENAAEVRAAACARLGWLGVEIDAEGNDRAEPDCAVGAKVCVIASREDLAMAAEARALLSSPRGVPPR